jgi:hypothetical protein
LISRRLKAGITVLVKASSNLTERSRGMISRSVLSADNFQNTNKILFSVKFSSCCRKGWKMGLTGGTELIYDSKSKSKKFHGTMNSTEYNPSMSPDRTVKIDSAPYQNTGT